MTISFLKMQGAGNDFLVLDQRKASTVPVEALQIRKLAHRQQGVGFDQLIHIAAVGDADVFMRIINADGSEIAACGNATRCVAWLLIEESGKSEVDIRTKAGLLHGRRTETGVVVDMGPARFGWNEIPLAREQDTAAVNLASELPPAFCVSMGNPHAVFFVSDASAINLGHWGPMFENHPTFPDRANISFATVRGPENIELRVWERGTGITLACGTAACATLVAAASQGLIPGRVANLHLPGGVLPVEWDANGHVWLGGPVAVAFTGQFRVEDYIA